MPDESDDALGFDDEMDEAAHHGPGGMASLEDLMGLGTRKKEKKPVLTIAPDEADTSESLESLEQPIGAPVEEDGREHIMPSLDLGHVPETEDSWQPADGPPKVHWADDADDVHTAPQAEPAMSAAFDAATASIPLQAGIEEAITPIDFGSIPSAQPIAFDDSQPPAPADGYNAGDALLPGEYLSNDFPQEEQPLEPGGIEPMGPADFEPEPPMDRLPSESPDPAGGPTELQPFPPTSEPSPYPAGPGFDALTEDWEAAPASPDANGMDLPGEVPLPNMDEPLDFSGNDGGEMPLDLDQFAEATGLDPQSWAAELDLPCNEETTDNPPVPAFEASDAAPPRERQPEPKPARHAIRVIAASVSNDGDAHRPQPARQDTSLVLLIVLAIGRGGKWLWNRFAKR